VTTAENHENISQGSHRRNLADNIGKEGGSTIGYQELYEIEKLERWV
jgi:hypothetical protein